MALVSLVAAGAGVGFAGDLASLIAIGALISYGRGQEREADDGGFDIGVAHGYDPRQAPAIWNLISAEEAANKKRKKPSAFFSSHPPSTERLATLGKRADEIEAKTQLRETGTDRYRAVTAPFRTSWLTDEMNRGEPAESLVLLDLLLQADLESGELHYYRGEAFRRRNGKGDLEQAINAYQTAIAKGGVPAAYRGLGLAAFKSSHKDVARAAFENYLSAAPEADDRPMIEYYLTASEQK
jgi:tetratricopeptide (TPR) repeat protein